MPYRDDELVHVSWFVSVMKQADPVNTIAEWHYYTLLLQLPCDKVFRYPKNPIQNYLQKG